MPDQVNNGSPTRLIALLIDADNISHTKVSEIIAELSKYGTTNIRRAYGDWSNSQLQGWRDRLQEFAIRPVQQFSYTSGKNATDIALVIDAMELMYTQKLSAFCIASSDGDFTPLAMQLKANGHDVYGFGERKTPSAFTNACTNFLYLDSVGPLAADEASVPAISDAALSKSPTDRKLSQDTKLVTVLRGAIEASIREDGWAAMSAAGSAVKRQAPIDPRNYGVKTFTPLYEKVGLFDVFKAKNGQAYVADKKNTERLKQPAI
jgi:uncharacterized LabA/DUF88 family protein